MQGCTRDCREEMEVQGGNRQMARALSLRIYLSFPLSSTLGFYFLQLVH